MAVPRVCVLRAPGTNCDPETAHAFNISGAEAERVHLLRLLENPEILDGFQILCVPGGFSYGDDIGAGVIFSSQLREQLGDVLRKFMSDEKLILGICNGFQVLLKSGILPGGAETLNAPPEDRQATLTWNDNGRYTARWVRLANLSPNNVFLEGIDEIDLPIAHAEGRLAVTDDSLLQSWASKGQVALCYRDRSGESNSESSEWMTKSVAYPDNPNRSVGNIAALGDPSGRVLGLMPHPERFIHATQHPNWTRLKLSGAGDGLKLFQNAVAYFA
jgi:phosphoribosylformylglycinamidine synthase subunit PurQ / glutaminase